MGSDADDRATPRDRLIVAFVLVLSVSATVAGFLFERGRTHERNQVMFAAAADDVRHDLQATMNAYAQFLRGGVSLFRSSGAVSRADWRRYVDDLAMGETYPGVQAVSYNALLRGPGALADLVRATRGDGMGEFEVRPGGARSLYAPILYLEPMSARNERAVGFDILSESHRGAAVRRAIESGEPSLSAQVTLAGGDADAGDGRSEAGVLLVQPVYRTGADVSSAEERRRAATGLIVSVFRIPDLMESVLAGRADGDRTAIAVTLRDVDPDASPTPMYGDAGTGRYATENAMALFGREWQFRAVSTPRFEAALPAHSDYVMLVLGLMVSFLLTAVVWAQAMRARLSRRAAATIASSHGQIEVLMDEVNHRSKNLLTLVQAIARQTRADDPGTFTRTFGERLGALSKSQDLLVRSGWSAVAIHELVRSQLAHFADLVDDRIVIEGEDFGLDAETAQTLGMALHELATNASKYGALSNDGGVVRIAWRFEGTGPAARFRMSWTERGGPPVAKPSRRGFGTKVTDIMARAALGGEIETCYAREGFEWHLACDADRIRATDGGRGVLAGAS
ncbi:CHASE domain-containing protein [Jannaschia sp. W003]|uniref:CHASE domain-containing protein n=1 Tax=Jannaschia sp. W003 TaxID=2867012 RepID=UPI0021A4B447|nr:CHASE domain-containing protein [Jannaschia sp. W003]UWQ20796.1 CHASE domain-containing protein [Jannaschia sp. W003]